MAKSKNTRKGSKNFAYQRVVVKFGTSLLTGGTNCLNEEMMAKLVDQVAKLHGQGLELLLVSSGAIAAGRYKLGVEKEPKDMPFKQVLASVGQGILMNVYDQLFSRHNITVAQALLTRSDLIDRAGYLNARNTLLALMELKVVGIVNENDVVAIDEIQKDKFGENDNLSAMVANLVDADLLLILSDIDGLYTADPYRNPDAQLIPQVDKIDAEVENLATDKHGVLGTGGMATKIEAAKLATDSGVTVIIANGSEPDIILEVAAGKKTGTCFLPVVNRLESRQRWMMSGLSTMGKLMVDAGAALALRKNKRSLLAAGIIQVEGEFQRGDIVDLYDTEGVRLGCGITNYCSADINVIKGVHSKKIASMLGSEYGSDVVHRNNLVVL
ncbi:glutamate 5-kinase [Chloroflexota bacterium]